MLGASLHQTGRETVVGMSAACEAKNSHTGTSGGQHAGDGILDHDRVDRIEPDLRGRKQEDIGRRFRALDLINGKHVRCQQWKKAGAIEIFAETEKFR